MMFGSKPDLMARQPWQGPVSTPPFIPPQAEAAPTRTPFLGANGAGRGIAGSIGDFLLQRAGAAPIYAPAMQQRAAEQQWQRRADDQRKAAMEQWIAQQTWERANPGPPSKTALQQNHEFFNSLGRSDLAESYLNNQANPLMGVEVLKADGSVDRVFMPRGGPAPAAQRPPIGAVIPDPRKAGGASQSGSQTFP